jgi:hypothetical protein
VGDWNWFVRRHFMAPLCAALLSQRDKCHHVGLTPQPQRYLKML